MEKNLEISDAKAIKLWGRDILSGVWSPGSVFYVDSAANGGSDDNDGSYDSPVLKVNAANALCTANKGDVIQVRGNSPSSPNDTATITMDKAGVTLRGLYGRGLLSDSGFGSPTTNVPTITITANYVTIEDLYLGCHADGTTGGIIDFTASCWGCTIRNIQFDTQYIAAYGIYSTGGHDLPYLLVEDCMFGRGDVEGYSTNGIYLANATAGIIRRNIFRRLVGVAIETGPDAANIDILDNRFSLRANTEGLAITLGNATNAILVDGNHANFGDTDMVANPYKDSSTATYNTWGLNYKGVTATLPA